MQMYTYSHYIFLSGATLSCCVLVCKNTGTCTVFNAKAPQCEYVCTCVCSNSSLKSLSQLKTKFTWDHHGIGEKIYSNDSGQLLFFILILSARGWGLLSGNLPQIWPGSAGLLAGL